MIGKRGALIAVEQLLRTCALAYFESRMLIVMIGSMEWTQRIVRSRQARMHFSCFPNRRGRYPTWIQASATMADVMRMMRCVHFTS